MEALSEPLGGDRNKGPAYLAVALTFCAVACVFVLLRMFVRLRMVRSTGWDDAFICVALVSRELLDSRNLALKLLDFDSEALPGLFNHDRRLQYHE